MAPPYFQSWQLAKANYPLQSHVVFTKKESVVTGHHIYKKSWTPVIGEVLPVEREEDNQDDDYAVAVTKSIDIFGHVPRSI